VRPCFLLLALFILVSLRSSFNSICWLLSGPTMSRLSVLYFLKLSCWSQSLVNFNLFPIYSCLICLTWVAILLGRRHAWECRGACPCFAGLHSRRWLGPSIRGLGTGLLILFGWLGLCQFNYRRFLWSLTI
jgi:hypothetical protein